jgi:hypothetical protein
MENSKSMPKDFCIGKVELPVIMEKIKQKVQSLHATKFGQQWSSEYNHLLFQIFR